MIKSTSLSKLISSIRNQESSIESLCLQTLDRVENENPTLNALISWDREKTLQKAREMDKQKPNGRLWGVPIVVKDNFCVESTRTTAASRALSDFIAPYTAECILRLEQEGALVIGKANMDEFAMGSSNENSSFGPCRNPWNTSCVPGGSSGGSAVSVAAGWVPLAIGSDTGGSIRQPASFCGVVGMKPTYGSISRYGMIAFASSLDQAGPLTQNVEDAALAMDIMVGRDPKDGTSVDRQITSLSQVTPAQKNQFKLGVPESYFSEHLDEDLRVELDKLLRMIETAGFQWKKISVPYEEVLIPIYYIISSSEASSNLARYDGVRYGYRSPDVGISSLDEFYKKNRSEAFGNEVKRRIMLGTFSLSSGYYDEYYQKAARVRRLLQSEFNRQFQDCDLVLMPTTPTPAFSLGEKLSDPMQMYLNDIFTVTANLCGFPALNLPIGRNRSGLPLGAQLMGPLFSEAKLISMSMKIQELVEFKRETC